MASNISALPISLISTSDRDYSQLITHYDENYQLAWGYMNAAPRPCFTTRLLEELHDWFHELATQTERDVKYVVLASDVPGVYNLGGDLQLFKKMINANNRDGLMRYARSCVDAVYTKMTGFGRDITHITLVQGDALGGGFECALSSDVLIAERSARLGLPEVLFNLFPGMGAYSILSRKVGSAIAERMILSGKIYTAEELYEMGVIDVLADDGQGEMAVYDYLARENRARNAYQSLRQAKACCDPVTHEELINITSIWVDAALRLQKRDLRMMERLVTRQFRKATNIA